MFAFFGLGTQEILLLLVLGGMIAVVVFIVLTMSRTSRGATMDRGPSMDRMAELEEENRRLRQELDRIKGTPPTPPPPMG